MSGRNQIILALVGILLVAIAAYFATRAMGLGEYQAGEEGAPIEGDLADMSPGQRLCAAQTTTNSIRERVFDRARDATENDPAALTRLETGTIARMESPRLVRFDDGLEEARCEGQLVLELPRGSEVAFSDNRRLTVNLIYYAQPSVSGNSTVVRMQGADGMIGRLASADLNARPRPELNPEDTIDTGKEDSPEIEGERPRPEAEDEIDYEATGLPPPIEDGDVAEPEDLLPEGMK